ncbi:MAG: winged helix-turn-helix domain-containing protein [Thermoplasmatota archaeon]
MRHSLWHLTLGTRGGLRRCDILALIEEHPLNAHEVAVLLSMDYKTARHHLGVLAENGLVVCGGGYGALYQWSAVMRQARPDWERIRSAVAAPPATRAAVPGGTPA